MAGFVPWAGRFARKEHSAPRAQPVDEVAIGTADGTLRPIRARDRGATRMRRSRSRASD